MRTDVIVGALHHQGMTVEAISDELDLQQHEVETIIQQREDAERRAKAARKGRPKCQPPKPENDYDRQKELRSEARAMIRRQTIPSGMTRAEYRRVVRANFADVL